MKLKTLFLALALATSSLTARTVVEVNGQSIDERDLIPIVQKITRGQYANLPNDKKQLAQKIALEQAIALVLLKEEAAQSNIKKSKEYKEAFAEYVKNVVEPTLSYQVWFERELNKMKIESKEVTAFYNENKERFNQPRVSHVHHILLKTEEEAADIIASIEKAKELKDSFMKAASEKMGTADTGVSDLGLLDDQSNMAPSFKEAYLKMKANELSKKPVKTQFGYHVIYIESVTEAQKKSLKEVRALIEKTIKGQKFEEILKAKVIKLREKAQIEFK